MNFLNNFINRIITCHVIFFLCSCGKPETYDFKVIGGEIVGQDEWPAIVSISNCTGTFIDHETLLSSAHCFSGRNYAYAKIDHSYVRAIDIIAMDDYDPEFRRGVNNRDIALVKFPPNTAPGTMELCSKTAKRRESVIIVGYGSDSESQQQSEEFPFLRRGFNTVDAVRDGMIRVSRSSSQITEDISDAIGWFGDSGGPLISSESNCIYGVLSGGTANAKYYVDIANWNNSLSVDETE